MTNKDVSKSSSNSIIDKEDLKSVIHAVAKNWYIIVAAVLIAYIASYLYLYKITNVFGAQTQLALESNEKINERSIIDENFGSYYNWWNLNSENFTAMRVIKSYDLIEKAVKRLKLDVSYFIVGRIKTTELYNANPYEIVIEALNPKYYEKEIGFKILNEKKYQLIFKDDDRIIVKEGFFDKEYLDLDVKVIIKNKAISKLNAPSLAQNDYEIIIHSTSTLVYRFRQALNVENTEGTKIFQITVEDVIPERAKAFLDTLTSAYIENSLLTRFQINTNTLNYIEKQMAEVTSVLNGIEDSLQTYKESRNILNLNKEEEDYFSKMTN
ncbi:MAG TPA: Wzz/FepE/Etk N-terminal domain-containing protein, partial [Bacteroidia bacterium]|nr:Wzz/FepE/Etk N-terminal domain-containing protein [Bacteroidia bacterium]